MLATSHANGTVLCRALEIGPVADFGSRSRKPQAGYKGAILENGTRVLVPPFIDVGTKIVVATADGTYVRRAES